LIDDPSTGDGADPAGRAEIEVACRNPQPDTQGPVELDADGTPLLPTGLEVLAGPELEDGRETLCGTVVTALL
jgi:hypothetical protein